MGVNTPIVKITMEKLANKGSNLLKQMSDYAIDSEFELCTYLSTFTFTSTLFARNIKSLTKTSTLNVCQLSVHW